MRAEPHEVKVLDHGYVKYVDHMGSDELIVESARMSTGKGFLGWEPKRCCVVCGATPDEAQNSRSVCRFKRDHRMADTKGDQNFLEYLFTNHHDGPFEMPRVVVETKAPIFIIREWQRHRVQSFNEMSARYVQMPDEHYVPALPRFTPKYSANKQESGVFSAGPLPLPALNQMRDGIIDQQSAIYGDYEGMIHAGVPKEVARLNTPVSRYSVMRAGVSLRGALDFLLLRNHFAAQWEMQQFAQAIDDIVRRLFPRTLALFDEYRRYATTFSRTEMKQLKALLAASNVEIPVALQEKLK